MMRSAQSQLYLFRGQRQSGFLVLRRSVQLCLAYRQVLHRREGVAFNSQGRRVIRPMGERSFTVLVDDR